MQISRLLLVSVALRALLIAYGELQDRISTVKYTDVDYSVFTDASRFVTQGQSPFLRSTYRYSPLLAYLVVPNVIVNRIWGKVLFSAADILAAWQLWRIGQLQGVTEQRCVWSVVAWLYNPFTVTISTRGSCDSLVTVMQLGVLLMLMQRQTVVAALVYGLAVHFRIYPIIYAPAIVLYLAHKQQVQAGNAPGSQASIRQNFSWVLAVLRQGAVFGSISGGVFLLLGMLFYHMYGQLFLQEAFLHHLTRKDPRHNFSIYYYPVYLSYMSWPGAAVADRVGNVIALYNSGGCIRNNIMEVLNLLQQQFMRLVKSTGLVEGREFLQQLLHVVRWLPAVDAGKCASIPQMALLLVFAAALHRNQPLCWLLQTMAFVAFNKVSTAQYFVWYYSLWPAVLQRMPWPLPKALLWAGSAWVVTQLHWLLWGYILEFQGGGVHLMLWFAGALFLLANTAVMLLLLEVVGGREWADTAGNTVST